MLSSIVLREFIQTILKEEWWSESYDKKIVDDDAFKSTSIIVNDDTKEKIKKWLKQMKMS